MNSEPHNKKKIDPKLLQNIQTDDYKIRFFSERVKGMRILDIGCVHHNPQKLTEGTWLHKALLKKAKYTLGIDIDRAGVEFLAERGFNVRVADATNFDLNETFDGIVAGDLIEHLANLEGFFQSCKRHLTENGKIYISTPNPWHWKRFLKVLCQEDKINEEHTCWFCPKTLTQLAKRYGFKLEYLEYGSRCNKYSFLPFPDRIKHTGFMIVLQQE